MFKKIKQLLCNHQVKGTVEELDIFDYKSLNCIKCDKHYGHWQTVNLDRSMQSIADYKKLGLTSNEIYNVQMAQLGAFGASNHRMMMCSQFMNK